jgi:hypothetical protein
MWSEVLESPLTTSADPLVAHQPPWGTVDLRAMVKTQVPSPPG